MVDGKEIINQDVIARSRLRVDARKWIASKLLPKKYGDKQLGTEEDPIHMRVGTRKWKDEA